MKIATLISRLAEKTNTPELIPVLQGDELLSFLPTECMLWTGAVLPADRPFGKKVRDRQNIPDQFKYIERKYGVIRWQGKMVSVQRLIFLLSMKPDFEFRMVNDCHISSCVNPLHFTIQELSKDEPEPDETITIGEEEPWDPQDVEDLVEILLGEQEPKNWEDVIANPLMEDIPHHMIRDELRNQKKEHLL